jgi:hypothetical protein
MVQVGENLFRSRGIVLPATKPERERFAQIEAYKDFVARRLANWRVGGKAGTVPRIGLARQAQFRQQMIKGMEGQLRRYREELRRLRSAPGSLWAGSTKPMTNC